MNEEDIILKFSDSKEGYSWATGGIYYFSTKIFNDMKNSFQFSESGLREFLRFLIDRGYILKGFSFSKIINIKYATDIAKVEDLITR